jgi:hypothetical protein
MSSRSCAQISAGSAGPLQCAAAPTTARRWHNCAATSPARRRLANECVQANTAGQVVLMLKTPWRDGSTHLVVRPLEFMQRLAALVPRPRLHLIRLVSAALGFAK